MSEPLVAFFTGVVSSLVTGIALALLGSWLGFRAYYRQQWWDRKSHGYVAVIEALMHLSLQFRSIATREIAGWSDERFAKSRMTVSESVLQLNRSIAMGELLYSRNARAALETFQREWRERVDQQNVDIADAAAVSEYIARGQRITDTAIDSVRDAAMSDLGLSRDRTGRLLRR